MSQHVGFGFDVHRFSEDPQRPLMLGGVHVEGHPGLEGHSDADVISHAITDALLGAAGHGDMGRHFPDTDERWKGADSLSMLGHALALVRSDGWRVQNVDFTLVTERPKLAPFRERIQASLEAVIDAPVNVKASRAEGLGALGRVEGAACWAVALLARKDDA